VSVFDPSDPAHARALERLGTEPFVWLTTVTHDGQPSTTPVWFWWDGERFLLYSQPDKPKLRNIASNPRVGVHLQSDAVGDEDVVIVEGVAEADPQARPLHLVPEYREKYRAAIERNGWTPEGMAGDYSVGVRVTPTSVRAW